MNPRNITILGSTGSIGQQALDVIRRHPELFKIHALVCRSNSELLIQQIAEFKPKMVAIYDEEQVKTIKKILKERGIEVEVYGGANDINMVAGDYDADIVLSAIVGFAGLEPTIHAIKSGATIALANKETLVVGGAIIKQLARQHSAVILPVDSEHSAIFQCIQGEDIDSIDKLFLTASGGPFVDKSLEELQLVTPSDALKHPNWSMGAKVTIDSATLMNKGLEMIEAHYLFDLQPKDIEILIHRQSIIHSMVGFKDGSVKAQLGLPDMRVPIAYALSYPQRTLTGVHKPALSDWRQLTFEEPDLNRFPCLGLALEAIAQGGTTPCVMNAANEVAVQRFLRGELRFTDIPNVVSDVISKQAQRNASSYDILRDADQEARKMAQAWYRK